MTLRRLFLLALLLPALALAQGDDRNTENMYLSGQEVRPTGPVMGDLVAAAGRITMDHYVQGDAVLAAGSIDIRGGIGDDLRAAGGVINLMNRVDGDLLVGGGNIAFGPSAAVGGNAWIAGYDVAAAGRFHRGLTIYARRILLMADVTGDVRLVANTIEVLPSARITGKLTYVSSRELVIPPGASIGSVVHEPGTFPRFKLEGWPAFRPLFALGLIAAGALLLWLFPGYTNQAVRTMMAAPLQSFGLGTAILFSMPPVIVLLVITIIGIPIALAACAIYALALLAGYLVAGCCFGDWLLHLVRKQAPAGYWLRVGALAVAIFLLWLMRHIPYYVGVLLTLLLLVIGLGALVLQAFSHYTKPEVRDGGVH